MNRVLFLRKQVITLRKFARKGIRGRNSSYQGQAFRQELVAIGFKSCPRVFVSKDGVFGHPREGLLCERLRLKTLSPETGVLERAVERVYWSVGDGKQETEKQDNRRKDAGKPSDEQLKALYNSLSADLPDLFTKALDYSIYSPNIVFEDNVRGLQIKGINAYIQSIAMVKILAHLKYSHVKMNILKITEHPEDGTIKVRWRVVGIHGLSRVLLTFWRYRLWDWKKVMAKENADWIDGFSVFYANGEGLIYKHVCDKMIPDSEASTTKKSRNMASLAN